MIEIIDQSNLDSDQATIQSFARIDWQARTEKAEERLAWMTLIGEEIVNAFPRFTLRNIAILANPIQSMKETISEYRRSN